jgi:hypothetical protein
MSINENQTGLRIDRPPQGFKQCRLVCDNKTQISWIPKKFAKKGLMVSFTEEEGEWEVIQVFLGEPL